MVGRLIRKGTLLLHQRLASLWGERVSQLEEGCSFARCEDLGPCMRAVDIGRFECSSSEENRSVGNGFFPILEEDSDAMGSSSSPTVFFTGGSEGGLLVFKDAMGLLE